MAYRDAASFGKHIEYKIMAMMLVEGLDVYTPLIDDHGVDCVVKRPNGTFVEIQIKARSKDAKQGGFFSVDKHENAIPDFYFIFYAETQDTMWVFSSEDFVKESGMNTGGKHAGRRRINLVSPRGNISKRFIPYIRKDFDFLK